MGDDRVKDVAAGVLRVNVGRVHVARHDREQLDVLPAERALENRTLAETKLVEGAVLDQRPHWREK